MNNIDKENLHKEMDLIQDCIKRMAHNSFLIKGWTITLMLALFTLGGATLSYSLLCFIGIIVILAFWYLDAFFLRTERMFIRLYSWVIDVRPKGCRDNIYDLNPHNFENKKWDKEKQAFEKFSEGTFKVAFSKTLGIYYGISSLILLCILIIFWAMESKQCTLTPNKSQNIDEKSLNSQHSTTVQIHGSTCIINSFYISYRKQKKTKSTEI